MYDLNIYHSFTTAAFFQIYKTKLHSVGVFDARMFPVGRVIAATVLIDRVIAGLNVVRLVNFIKIMFDTGR